MSIIGVQIAAALHADQHPERVADCMACDLRAGDYEAAHRNYERQTRMARNGSRKR